MANNTLETVKRIASDISGAPEEIMNSESDFKGDMGMDSLDFIDFVLKLEQEFLIDIPAKDYGEIQTLGGMVAYIEKATPLQ